MTERINGGAFKQMVLFGAACITAQKQAINDLNVFPVPDGDTGTNMSLTIQTAAAELRKSEPASVGEAAKITASALLRGARGNSGVILSLLFRGMSKSCKNLNEMDGAQLAAAMTDGVTTAYSAVMKPAEGTVLTVSRLAAARAVEAAGENNNVEYVLAEAIKAGYVTLEETIEMNPVLKKAGVVDAGGKGYLIVLEGMLRALQGEAVPEVEDTPEQDKADFGMISDEEITFTYDTVFIVRKTSELSLEPLRAYLSSIGDCLVIGEDDDAFKVHVHTDTPGDASTESQKYGTLELAKSENMRTQHEEVAAGRKAQSADDLDDMLRRLCDSILTAEEAPASQAVQALAVGLLDTYYRSVDAYDRNGDGALDVGEGFSDFWKSVSSKVWDTKGNAPLGDTDQARASNRQMYQALELVREQLSALDNATVPTAFSSALGPLTSLLEQLVQLMSSALPALQTVAANGTGK